MHQKRQANFANSKDLAGFAISNLLNFLGSITWEATETQMMGVRWKVFEFYHRIPRHEQKNIIPCPRCFAELIFLGNSD